MTTVDGQWLETHTVLSMRTAQFTIHMFLSLVHAFIVLLTIARQIMTNIFIFHAQDHFHS
jgi:hypothetical protein